MLYIGPRPHPDAIRHCYGWSGEEGEHEGEERGGGAGDAGQKERSHDAKTIEDLRVLGAVSLAHWRQKQAFKTRASPFFSWRMHADSIRPTLVIGSISGKPSTALIIKDRSEC